MSAKRQSSISLICPKCSGDMYVARRVPLEHDPHFEIMELVCTACNFHLPELTECPGTSPEPGEAFPQ